MNIPNFDKSEFTNETFLMKVDKPWGHELIFTPANLPYSGKIMHVQAGKRLSLQIHDAKQESYFLFNGRCNLICENTAGEVITLEMKPQKGYSIKVGQKHRLHAITDCDVFEVATPEIGTTYRLEDDYKRPDETDDLRTSERKDLPKT